MADKALPAQVKDNILDDPCRELDDFIAAMIAVVVIVGFEIVQVGIAKGKRRAHIEMACDLLLDDSCARKLGRWVHSDISAVAVYHTANANFDEPVDPLTVDEFFGAILKRRDHSRNCWIWMVQNNRDNGQKDVLLDSVYKLQFFQEVTLATDNNCIHRIMAADLKKSLKVLEVVKRDLVLAEEAFEMKIKRDRVLSNGKMIEMALRNFGVFWRQPVLEDEISGVLR